MTEERQRSLAATVFSETWHLLDAEVDLPTTVVGDAATAARHAVLAVLHAAYDDTPLAIGDVLHVCNGPWSYASVIKLAGEYCHVARPYGTVNSVGTFLTGVEHYTLTTKRALECRVKP